MQLNKRQFFLFLIAAWMVLDLLYQCMWIFSPKTTAEVEGMRQARVGYFGSGGHSSAYTLNLIDARYLVGDKVYYGSYLQNGFDPNNHSFEIRYLPFAPGISRSNTFIIMWGTPILCFALISLITAITFIRKDVISAQAIIIVQSRLPFVKIRNNKVQDYDQPQSLNRNPDEAERQLKEKLQTEAADRVTGEIETALYKFNPNAIAIFVLYVPFFFWYFFHLFIQDLGYVIPIGLGAILLFVPLYVQNTNNPTFKAKIPDPGSLVFSAESVRVGSKDYSIMEINAAVVYLGSFQGFIFREGTSMGEAREKSAGDDNRICFRYGRDDIDLTFILDDAISYWSLKELMSKWSARGVKVLLQKAFEDDFIIREMVHFGLNAPLLSAHSPAHTG